MSLKKINFGKGQAVDATCLNNMQSAFDIFLLNHQHNGVEAPFIDSREVSSTGYEINSANKTLYEHTRDYSSHSGIGSSVGTENRLGDLDYVEVGIIDSCDNWSFNGIYWETTVKLKQPYSEDYTVEIQPIYTGNYISFFQELNPEANFANISDIVPLNNSLLHINVTPINLQDSHFTVRLYALGKGTRHQLVAYDEYAFLNKSTVYSPQDMALPIAGNVSQGVFKIPYGGGFNFIPKRGLISIPVDINLNVSATYSGTKQELVIGDSIQSLPFNIGKSSYFAFLESAIKFPQNFKDLGFISDEEINNIEEFTLDDFTDTQRDNIFLDDNSKRIKRRTFNVVNKDGVAINQPISDIIKAGQTSEYFVLVSEEIRIQGSKQVETSVKKIMFSLTDVEVINDSIVRVVSGLGILVPRAVDSYGNIEETNVHLMGEYEVLDDEQILIKNISYNGSDIKDLFYEPPADIDVVIADGDFINIDDEEISIINYDSHQISLDAQPYFVRPITSNTFIDFGRSKKISFPNLQEISKKSYYAKSSKFKDLTPASIKIRPKTITINEGARFITNSQAIFTTVNNIILMRKDLLGDYAGSQEKFLFETGTQTHVNEAECFKTLNKMSYMTPETKTHFYTGVKWPKKDGTFQTGYAEVLNNNIINYLVNEQLDFTLNKASDSEQINENFISNLKHSLGISGSLHSYLSEDDKRVYYIETLEKPSDAVMEGSKVRLLKLDDRPTNYANTFYSIGDFGKRFEKSNPNPLASLFPEIGVVREVSKQPNGSYRIYLYSPSHGWNSNTTHIDKVFSGITFPSDVVNINGEPVFLYPNPVKPSIITRVECFDGSSTLINKTKKITNNDYDYVFGFDIYDEDEAADTINQYLYLGFDLPFNRVSFVLENILDEDVLDSITWQYLDSDGDWTNLTLLSEATSSNLLLKYDERLNYKDSNNLAHITFQRPDVSGAQKWNRNDIPEFASEIKYWVRAKLSLVDYATEDFEARQEMYPAFRTISVSTLSESEIEIEEVSPNTLDITYTSNRINALGFDDVAWDMVRSGDFISWKEPTGEYRSTTITEIDSSSPDTVYIYLDDNPYIYSGSIDKLRIRKNPLAFIRNINFEDDKHLNTKRKTNSQNPIAPLSTAGFFGSLAYSTKKQQFFAISDDVQSDYSIDDVLLLRPCFDEYETSPFDVEFDIDKFSYDAEFIFDNIQPIVETTTLNTIADNSDIIRLYSKLWVNKFAVSSDELFYFICRPANEDRYYLAIYSNNPLPTEENLSSWNLGVFSDKQGYIWNDNHPILSRDFPLYNDYPPTFNSNSLEFNQRINNYAEGINNSFGGRDVIGFSFNTDDIFESYNVSRPDFENIVWTNTGQIYPFDNVGVGTNIDFSSIANGGAYYKLVLPVNINTFGDIFRNYNTAGQFYYSEPRTILTKEYSDTEDIYKIDLLSWFGSSSYQTIEEIERNDENFSILLNDADILTKSHYAKKVLSGEYRHSTIIFNNDISGSLVNARLSQSRTNDNIEKLYARGNFSPFLTSEKIYDLGKRSTQNSNDDFETPIPYRLTVDSSTPNNLSDVLAEVGDGVYAITTPISNIKHYSAILDGKQYGVDVQLSDSYQKLDSLFVIPGDGDTFEEVEEAYELISKSTVGDPNLESTLIWSPARWNDEAGIFIANWGCLSDDFTASATPGILDKFVATGQLTESPDSNVIYNNVLIKNFGLLKDFMIGSSVFVRYYNNINDDYDEPYAESFLGVVEEVITNSFDKRGTLPKNLFVDGEMPDFAEMYLKFVDDQSLFSNVMSLVIPEIKIHGSVAFNDWYKVKASALNTTLLPTSLRQDFNWTSLLSAATKLGTEFSLFNETNGDIETMPLFIPNDDNVNPSHHFTRRLVFRKAKDGLYDVLNYLESELRNIILKYNAQRIDYDIVGPSSILGGEMSGFHPSYSCGSVNLITIVQKDRGSYKILSNILEADKLNPYYSKIFAQLFGEPIYGSVSKGYFGLGSNKKLLGGYEILVGDSSFENTTTISRNIGISSDTRGNILEADDLDLERLHIGMAVIKNSITSYANIANSDIYGYIKSFKFLDDSKIQIILNNGKTLAAGTYKTVFYYTPLNIKLPEDNTRHTFYSADFTDNILYTNNVTFDYESRKVLETHNDKVFGRKEIAVERNPAFDSNGFVTKQSDAISLFVDVPNFKELVRVKDVGVTVLAIATFIDDGMAIGQFDSITLEPNQTYYRLFYYTNNEIKPISDVDKFQLVGDGNFYFICVNAENQIYQFYSAKDVRIGGGVPNYVQLQANNILAYSPITQYAYSLVNAGIFDFKKNSSLLYEKEEKDQYLDHADSKKKWVGNIGNKYFYLSSKGTKGFESVRFETLVGAEAQPWQRFNDSFSIGSANKNDFDAIDSRYSKFFQPYCTLYSPAATPLSNGTLLLPHFKYNEATGGVNTVFTTQLDDDIVSGTDGYATPSMSLIGDNVGCLYLQKDRLLAHNIFDETLTPSSITNIFEELGVNANTAFIKSKIKDLLSSNPVAFGKISVYPVSTGEFSALGVHLGSENISIIKFLYSLNETYGIDLTPYLHLVVYSQDSIYEWKAASLDLEKPTRQDGKITDVKMIELDIDYLIQQKVDHDLRLYGAREVGYYIKILYAEETSNWETQTNNIFGYQIGPAADADGTIPLVSADEVKQWQDINLLGLDKWWRIKTDINLPRVIEQEAEATIQFDNKNISDWRDLGTAYNQALTLKNPLFNIDSFEKIAVKSRIDSGDIEVSSEYQWVWIGNLYTEIYNKPVKDEFDTLFAGIAPYPETTLFSSNDWNKLTKNFDIVLDDDFLDTKTSSLIPYGSESIEGEVYTKKFNALIGSGPRFFYDEEWYSFKDWGPLSDGFTGNDLSGWVEAYATSSFARPLNKVYSYSQTITESAGRDFINIVQTGNDAVFYGFQPNAAIISENKTASYLEKRGWLYFGVPKLFDYLRLPKWMLETYDEDIYLEVYTSAGWTRCPIEKNFGSINIRLPHPNYTDNGSDAMIELQDVEYVEILPLIPRQALLCGPGTPNPKLFPEFGYLWSNGLYYDTHTVTGDPFVSPTTWQENTPAWGSAIADWCVRPISGYYFRVMTNIGTIDSIDHRIGILLNRGNVTNSSDREKILRLLHTTVPQFVSIIKNDCWIEDVQTEGDTLKVVVVGYKTIDDEKQLRTEIHYVKLKD